MCCLFKDLKKPHPQAHKNLNTIFFSLSSCLLKKEVAIVTDFTHLSPYVLLPTMSLFLAREQMVHCNAHQTNISLISIIHRSTLRMNPCMFRKHSDSMLNKCCKTTIIYTVHTISKHKILILSQQHNIYRFSLKCGSSDSIISAR